MLEFQKKKKIRNIVYSKATIFALFVILIFVGRSTLGIYYKQRTSRENLIEAKKEVLELKKREEKLNLEINRLKTDNGTEEEIRKKFMVGKAGEQIIVIVDDEKSNKNDAVKRNEDRDIWSKILDFFK